MIHEVLWERLASLAPADVIRRTGACHDFARGHYTLPLIDRHVRVDPASRTMEWHDRSHQAEGAPGYNAALATAVYLIEAKESAPAGEWVTAESLPSGAFFFRGPHTIPTAEPAHKFGHDPNAFLMAGTRLGGQSVEWGDACIEIPVLPRIAVRLVLWLGDGEFPARATMLFDSLVDEHMPLDALYCMARHLVSAFLRACDERR